MATDSESQSSETYKVSTSSENTVTLRVLKPNLQVVVLGLVAFITLFQTVQLVKIGEKAGSTPVKAAPAAATTTTTSGSGSGTDVPQSMVGGC